MPKKKQKNVLVQPVKRSLINTAVNVLSDITKRQRTIKWTPKHSVVLAEAIKGKTQDEIAKQLKISQSNVSQHEADIRRALTYGLTSIGAMRRYYVEKMAQRESVINQELQNSKPKADLWEKAKSEIQNVIDIMRDDPSTYTDKYLCGFMNGMLLSQSCVEGTEVPNYIDSSVVVPLDYIGKENVKIQSWDLEKIVRNKPWWLPSKLYWKLIEPFVKTVDVPSVPPFHPNCRGIMIPVEECDCVDCKVERFDNE